MAAGYGQEQKLQTAVMFTASDRLQLMEWVCMFSLYVNVYYIA